MFQYLLYFQGFWGFAHWIYAIFTPFYTTPQRGGAQYGSVRFPVATRHPAGSSGSFHKKSPIQLFSIAYRRFFLKTDSAVIKRFFAEGMLQIPLFYQLYAQ
jgi:hypothetical protein